MTSREPDRPTEEELTELRDRTWALVYPETWKPGTLLQHNRGPFQVRYSRETNEVELWRKSNYDPSPSYNVKLTFRRPPYDEDWLEDCTYCITAAECLPQLRELMVLDDLADV